jgi:transcriptional regulator
MYAPDHFAEMSVSALHDLIARNPLSILFTNGKNGMDANHIPFILDPAPHPLGSLHAHVARANSVWQDVADGDEVLAVFRLADSYITPTWYPSTQETHRQVPTWNYMVAHAYGRVKIHDDERYVRAIVARLTQAHEAGRDQPWRMTQAPKDYIDGLVKAVVGIEIEITRFVGKSKLNQDDGPRDMRGAGAGLLAQANRVIGDEMIARADILHPQPTQKS